jgi:hypothetical protein
MQVVVGAGADGLRAAAALAATGAAVLLLTEADTPHGLKHPDIPEGTGRMWIDPSVRSAAEAAVGPMVDAPMVQRAIARNGRIHTLPLSPLVVPNLFSSAQLLGVGRDFLKRRVRNGLIPLTGEGQEERTYREWVIRRMGEPAYQHFYAPYARRRWGLDGDALSVAVARQHHNPHMGSHAVVPGGGPRAAFDHAVAVIEANGGEVRCGVKVRSLKVADGKVVAVRVGRRNIELEGPIWIARPHEVTAGWLGDALDSGLHVDASKLHRQDRVQVAFEVDQTGQADEIHLLDEDDVAWRVTQVYGNTCTAVFHCTVPADAPDPNVEDLARRAHSLGWESVDPSTAKVERVSDWVPVWAPLVHTRLRRLSLAWARLGVVAVGRRGTFSPVDAGGELALAIRYGGEAVPDQSEAMRVLLDPPVLDQDINASFRDFIWA